MAKDEEITMKATPPWEATNAEILTTTATLLKSVSTYLQEEERKVYGDLPPGQMEILGEIGDSPVNQKYLAARIGCSGGNVTLLLDALEVADLAKRERNEKDRRAMDVTLTKKGKALAKKLADSQAATAVKMFQSFSETDLKNLNSLLNKLVVN